MSETFSQLSFIFFWLSFSLISFIIILFTFSFITCSMCSIRYKTKFKFSFADSHFLWRRRGGGVHETKENVKKSEESESKNREKKNRRKKTRPRENETKRPQFFTVFPFLFSLPPFSIPPQVSTSTHIFIATETRKKYQDNKEGKRRRDGEKRKEGERKMKRRQKERTRDDGKEQRNKKDGK